MRALFQSSRSYRPTYPHHLSHRLFPLISKKQIASEQVLDILLSSLKGKQEHQDVIAAIAENTDHTTAVRQ